MSTQIRFDPFACLRGDVSAVMDAEGTVYPGEMMQQHMRDAVAVIESQRGKPDQPVIDAALALLNSWAAALSNDTDQEDDGSARRRTIMGAFLAGFNAANLADLTAPKEIGPDELQAYAQRLAARAATEARQTKVQARETKIRKVWATGAHVSRDRCAHIEWERLGFPSFRAAREALNNTPDPLR